jgi:phytoene desaturase
MLRRVSVIGAGLGGLAAAIRLAQAGFSVTIFEQNARTGGKMNEYSHDGYRFDTGPSLLTMSSVVDDLFNFAGFKRDNFLDFIPIEPLCRYFFPDKTIFDAHSNRNKMLKSLANFIPHEMENFIEYMKYCERLYSSAGITFLYSPIHEIRKILTRDNLSLLFKLYRLDSRRTVVSSLKSFFTDQRLIQLFARYTTYNGSNPFQAPATLNIIPYVEYNLGAYYIKGGMYRLVETLTKICHLSGIQIRLESRVNKLWHENGRIKGLFLDNERVESEYVICNSDVVYTFDRLIDGYDKERKKLKKLEPSLSAMVFLWNVNKYFPQLMHHNIFFSRDYRREFEQMFRDHAPADDPTIYVALTCRSDKSHAPEGSENWFVLINMPYIDKRQNWLQYVQWVKKRVLQKLKEYGQDVGPHICGEKIFTPESFAQIYGANRGSIYGLSSNSRFSAFLRPPNRNRKIKGLYFVGGSTHPGGGIPLVLLSGKMVADLISEHHK